MGAPKKRPEPSLAVRKTAVRGPLIEKPETGVVSGIPVVGTGVSQSHDQSDQAFFSSALGASASAAAASPSAGAAAAGASTSARVVTTWATTASPLARTLTPAGTGRSRTEMP